MINNKNPSDEKVNEAFETMRLSRENFLLTNPFFAFLSLKQELVEASSWLKTMAVDGKHLFFNSDFVLGLSVEEIKFVMGHEILHLAYGHLERRKIGLIAEFDPELFNIACDYCVNRDLVNSNIGKMPEIALYDRAFEHYISEEVYVELLKNPEKHKGKETLDEHLDISGNDPTADGNSGPDIKKDSNGNRRSQAKPKYDEKTAEQNMDKFKDDLLIASEEVGSDGAGNIPRELQRIINELTKPKINWRHYLKKMIQSQIKNDLDWSRGSRRNFDSKFHFPGDGRDDELSVHLCIDTSGSMTNDMVRDFLSEVYGIMRQFEDYKIRIWTFDTEVYNYKEFTPDNSQKLKKYEVIGQGGTVFTVNWDFMKKEKIKPDLFVMFTDGMPCSDWGHKNYCETLYIIHSNPKAKAPSEYGRTVHYP
jgi:predicted metal-dependent peptidase